jgi:ArsR family transcriptional regulator
MTVAARTMDLEKTARLCHALSDETRLRLLELLMEGEQCVCDLTDTLRTGQSRLSFHLKTLKDAGLLVDRRDGRWVYYALVPDALDDLDYLVKRLRGTIDRRPGPIVHCE